MRNSWAAYQVDNAVAFVGFTIENALAERVKVGTQDAPEWRDKYTLEQILAPDFRLPRPGSVTPKQTAAQAVSAYIDTLIGSAGKIGSGGRVFQYVPPTGGQMQ